MKNSIGLFYQLTVTDKKTGKIIRKTKLRRSKSLVKQFLQICEAQMFGTVNVTPVKDITGSDEEIINHANNLNIEAGVGAQNFGTQVGTGTTAPTNTDYVIETLIAHGVGAGQLSYGVQSKTTTGVVGPNVDFITTRTFTNSSGGSIDVTEAGIYCLTINATAGTPTMLIARDTFVAVAVGDGQVLTVTYTLRTTV